MQEVSCDADENLDNDESGMEVQQDDSMGTALARNSAPMFNYEIRLCKVLRMEVISLIMSKCV